MKAILKQTSWLFFAQVLTRIVSFFYVIFLARTLGVFDFGLYSVALAYFAIISSFADFGFNRFLIREVARDKSKAPELLWNITMLRLTLTSVLFAVFAAGLYILDPDKMRVSLILLATISILPQAIAFTFDAVFVALQKLQYSGLSLFISSLATAICGFLLVKAGFGAVGAVNAVILGQAVYAAVLVLILYKFQGLRLTSVTLAVIIKAIKGSLPYGVLGILGLLYFRIDTIMLSYMKGSFETGIYGAAYKFVEAMVFIPSALSLALFPVMARLHEHTPAKIKPLYINSLKIMGIFGLLITLAYIIFLPVIIRVFLPNYLSSIDVIKILALAIPFMFIHIPGAQILLSTDKYLKQILVLSVLTLSFNLVLNLIFIPKYGFIGASWTTVASEALSFLVFFELLRRKVFAR
ncbi:flippase [Patescibacteria group bacterium]|nr:flippase [Patescibacteria group bacterium]